MKNWINCGDSEMKIRSQAWQGIVSHDGSETTRVSPNNNLLHECPASFYWDDDIVRTYGNMNREIKRIKSLFDNTLLKDASMTGRESTLPNGRIGQLLNFTIYVSNNYTAVSDTYNCYHVIFGHKSALTFAAQMDYVETLKNPDDYGDLIRGLMVYGYKVVKPAAMGELYCRRG